MPDWQRFVTTRLGRKWGHPADAEVVAELAHHLEDCYADHLSTGLTPTAAIRKAVRSADGLRRLTEEQIGRRTPMNSRTRRLWLPAMLTLILANTLLALFTRSALRPTLVAIQGRSLVIYTPWLLLLPGISLLGAWLSLRAGASRLQACLAGLFPAVAFLLVFVVALPIALFVDRPSLATGLSAWSMVVLNWVVIPALLLSVGLAPVAKRIAHQKSGSLL